MKQNKRPDMNDFPGQNFDPMYHDALATFFASKSMPKTARHHRARAEELRRDGPPKLPTMDGSLVSTLQKLGINVPASLVEKK